MFRIYKIKILLAVTLLAAMVIVIQSCKDNTQIVGSQNGSTTATAKKSTISGQVVSNSTGIPIDSAEVMLYSSSMTKTLYTDSKGKFSTSVELTDNTDFTLLTIKSGYKWDTTYATVPYGSDYTVSLIQLTQNTTGSTSSGNPVSIYLANQSSDNIGVKESGSVETARLTFEVQDSSGNPIDLDHSVDVNFYLGSAPGGGETISPADVKTNTAGQATVNLTSGTKAGVVQIVAKVFLGSKTIVSTPVSITIHGGLPDLDHFSISAANINFPGYDIYGSTDKVTAYVGDKYGNPVKTGTAVYFTSTGGIIEGSALTNSQGIGSVNLLSADPKPDDPVFGPGFARITASTANENLQTIQKQAVILFSGNPQISVSPTTFDIPNGGSQSFNYTVADENGNPLSKGTSITVSVSGSSVGSQGDLNVTLPDTQDKTWTQFNFVVYDKVDTVDTPNPVTVNILTSGPNGGAKTTFSGISR